MVHFAQDLAGCEVHTSVGGRQGARRSAVVQDAGLLSAALQDAGLQSAALQDAA